MSQLHTGQGGSIFVIGDIHLYDREMASTKGYLKANDVMLDVLYNHIVAHPDIQLVIFEGDIQHKTPIKIKEIHKWRSWFRKLGKLMSERTGSSGWDIEVHGRESLAGVEVENAYPVFSLRGNHDVEATNRSNKDFTFFDELLHEGLLQNPKGLTINGDTYLDFRNYGEADVFPDPELIYGKRVVGLFHDTLYHRDSPSFIQMLREINPAQCYDAHEVFKGLDVAICGHIHNPTPLTQVERESGSTTYLQTGSMARTSFGGDNVRDVGYSATIRLADLEVTPVELAILPIDEFFNLQRIANRNRDTPSYEDFNLDMEDVEDTTYSVEEAIRAMEGVLPAVREAALNLLQTEQD